MTHLVRDFETLFSYTTGILPYCFIFYIVPLVCTVSTGYPIGKLCLESEISIPTLETLFSYSDLAYCVIFLHSVSTLEDVSFVSAEESVADLRDFDELRQEENSFLKHKFRKETKIRERSFVFIKGLFQCQRGPHIY